MSKEIKNYITYFFKSNKQLLLIECLVLFVFMPFALFNSSFLTDAEEYAIVVTNIAFPALVCTFVLGFVLPLYVWNFLYKRTSCDLYYSLPIKKSTMYWVQYGLGAVFGLLPIILNMLFEIGIIGAMTHLQLLPMVKVLGALILVFMITYSIFTFVCLKCNNLLDAVVVSVAYVVVPLIVFTTMYGYVGGNAGKFLIGYSGSIVNEIINSNAVLSFLFFPFSLSVTTANQLLDLPYFDDQFIQCFALMWLGIGFLLMIYSRHCYMIRNEEDAQQRTKSWVTFPFMINSIIISLFLVLFSIGDINTTSILVFLIVFIIYAAMRLFANRSLKFKIKDLIYFIVLCLFAGSFTFAFNQSRGFHMIHEIPKPKEITSIDFEIYAFEGGNQDRYSIYVQDIEEVVRIIEKDVIKPSQHMGNKNVFYHVTILYNYGVHEQRNRIYNLTEKEYEVFMKAMKPHIVKRV